MTRGNVSEELKDRGSISVLRIHQGFDEATRRDMIEGRTRFVCWKRRMNVRYDEGLFVG